MANSIDTRPALLMPAGVLQPFQLRFRRDDLHVMAFFKGHPEYEAVEAMILARPDGENSIRAIITRRDQTQIDLVNDDALHRGPARADAFRCPCAPAAPRDNGRPRPRRAPR